MSWHHPQLGTFEFDDYWWVQELEIPAFKSFTFTLPYHQSHGSHEVGFDADDESDLPSRIAAAVAVEVIGSLNRLVPMAIDALWADLSGTGRDSGMWWNGALPRASKGNSDELNGMLETLGYNVRLPALTSVAALSGWLRPKSVRIRKGTFLYKKPVAELCFDAAFDPEHGVGLLTDGKGVIGIGYSGDADLFEST